MAAGMRPSWIHCVHSQEAGARISVCLGPQPVLQCCPHSRCVFVPQLNLTGKALTDTRVSWVVLNSIKLPQGLVITRLPSTAGQSNVAIPDCQPCKPTADPKRTGQQVNSAELETPRQDVCGLSSGLSNCFMQHHCGNK